MPNIGAWDPMNLSVQVWEPWLRHCVDRSLSTEHERIIAAYLQVNRKLVRNSHTLFVIIL